MIPRSQSRATVSVIWLNHRIFGLSPPASAGSYSTIWGQVKFDFSLFPTFGRVMMLQSIFLQFHFESCYWGRRRGWVGTESVFDTGVTPISHSFIFRRNHLHLFHDHHHDHHHRHHLHHHHHRGIHFCTAAVNVQESGRFNIFPVYCLSQEIRDR